MPASPARPGSGAVFSDRGSGKAGDLMDFVRYSHIFAALVREILEVHLLRATTQLPLTVNQFHLLKLIALDGHHHLSDVAAFLGVSAPAATKNIDKLERLGLAARTPSMGDRRATWLTVSPEGRRLVQEYEERKSARLAPVLHDFPAAHLAALTKLLERISVSLVATEAVKARACLRCAANIDDACPIAEVLGGCPYQVARQARASADAKPSRGHAR
jgi:DNA-binding MarR family transcriptional regulator